MSEHENTITIPGKASTVKTNTQVSESVPTTSYTSVANFEQIKHLLSDKPLREPVRGIDGR